MKKVRRMLTVFVLTFFAAGFFSMQVKAEEGAGDSSVTKLNQVMTVLTDCDMKELPEEGAASIQSYSAGSSVWVIGETENGWYMVSYQEQEGYIPKEYITSMQVEVEGKGAVGLDVAGLDAEMAAMEAESEMLIKEVERQRGEAKRSRIWTIIIVLLVIGIFATGIISTMKMGKNKKKDDSEENIKTDKSDKKNKNNIEVVDLDSEEE